MFTALLPTRQDIHPLGCHRPRIPDRVIFDKFIQVLVFGCGYRRIDDTTRTTLAERDLQGQIAHKGIPAPGHHPVAGAAYPRLGQPVRQAALVHRAHHLGRRVLDLSGAGDRHVGSAAPPGLDPPPLGGPPTAPTVTATGQPVEDDACPAGSPLGRQTMFAGLDDVDWAAMHHAYGPATDVPDLLRGLLADDAQAREIALDGLYGAVHHQADEALLRACSGR
jgi:hypothetical protein